MSAGGISLRLHTWVLIWALDDFYRVHTNMYAEAMALCLYLRLQKCYEEGFRHVDIKVDSYILVQFLEENVNVP
ncbi:hypothetical protein LguiA_029390 [Lonicera macranthoides]